MDTEVRQTMAPELAAALVKAQAEVRSALKTSENKFHGYKYASAEEVVLVGRDALNANGCALLPDREDFEPRDLDADKVGGATAILRCSYLVVHASGASYRFSTDVPICPERGRASGWSRPADKATFGARTEALGYAYRDLLSIPREDAPDVSGRGDGAPRPRPAQAPAQQQQPAPIQGAPDGIDERLLAIQGAQGMKALQGALVRGRQGLAPADVARVEQAYAARVVEQLGKVGPEQVEVVDSYVTRANLKGDAAIAVTAAIEAARKRAPAQGAP
jgi:hypothetical protein